MLRSVANLRDDCTGSGLRAVLEALPPPPAPREFREAGLEAGRGAGDVEAGRGAGDIARAGALARRRGGVLPLRKRRVEVSHAD